MITPLISIVLPTHNGSRYIEESIGSCLSQTYKNWELIIVDDASTDGTLSKLRTFTDARLRVIRHQVNRRLPATLNTGFSRARGEYLTWTSDDNYYRPTALQEMITYLQEHPHIAVVYTDYSIIDERGTLIGQRRVPGPETLVEGNCAGPCFLYRRDVQAAIGGYSEDLFLAEDYDFWVRTSILFHLAPLHKDLYCYRLHKDSLTSLHPEMILVATDRSLGRNLGKMRWVSPPMKSKIFIHLARRARGRGEKGDAIMYMLQSALHSPAEFLLNVKMHLERRLRPKDGSSESRVGE